MMPDPIKSADPKEPSQPLPDHLRELLNLPTFVSGSNTMSYRIEDYRGVFDGRQVRTRNTTATELTDIRAVAEGLMFESTRLVSMIERQDVAPNSEPLEKLVSVVAVLKGGAAITAGLTCICALGTYLSGSILIHPLLSTILLVSSVGFYLMSLVSPR